MRSTLHSLKHIAFAVVLPLVFLSQSARADLITLTINSAQSNLSLTGGAFGLNFAGQSSGSLVTSLSGTITADLTGGVFTFAPGSNIVFNANPNGPFTASPNTFTIPGVQNYGVTASGFVAAVGGNATINGVYSGLVLDITAGSAQNGVAPTGTLAFQPGSTLTFGAATPLGPVGPAPGGVSSSGSNTSTSLVSWDGSTLILPIAFQTTGGNGRVENWLGSITAVPEPSSLGLVALVGFGFAAVRRRKKTC